MASPEPKWLLPSEPLTTLGLGHIDSLGECGMGEGKRSGFFISLALLLLATVETVELAMERDDSRNLRPIKKYKPIIRPIGRTKKMIVEIMKA